jgi:DNA repair photolyase
MHTAMKTHGLLFAAKRLSERDADKGLSLAERVHPKYQPVFDRLGEADRAAVALYFLPHGSKKDVLEVTRPRVVKWYCPFADQRMFPSGHRYSINVYTGCEHKCRYCYVNGYSARQPDCKERFRRDLCKDLEALEVFDVPPAPVHLSNSTDALQPLEQEHRHTLFTLEMLAEHRNRFTTVTLLTKNPAALVNDRYIRALQRLNDLPADHPRRIWFEERGLSPLRLEVSLAFFNGQHCRLLDPAAPSVESRMEAIGFLRQQGLPVFLRIGPLFPRDPLSGGKTMADFGLPDVQPMSDLEGLVRFGREVAAIGIVYSVAKITRPQQGALTPVMEQMKRVYQIFPPGSH